jgi:hypothetical protein
MSDPKIGIYVHPNPEIKSFTTMEPISPPRVEHFKNPLNTQSEMTLKQLGIIGAQIVKEVMAIPGVKEIRIKPKEIRMKKEIKASWDDIEDKVCKILNRALQKKGIKIVKG